MQLSKACQLRTLLFGRCLKVHNKNIYKVLYYIYEKLMAHIILFQLNIIIKIMSINRNYDREYQPASRPSLTGPTLRNLKQESPSKLAANNTASDKNKSIAQGRPSYKMDQNRTRIEQIKKKYERQEKPSELKIDNTLRQTNRQNGVFELPNKYANFSKYNYSKYVDAKEKSSDISYNLTKPADNRMQQLNKKQVTDTNKVPDFPKSKTAEIWEEQRVESIDKINLKIQKIMKCMTDNDEIQEAFKKNQKVSTIVERGEVNEFKLYQEKAKNYKEDIKTSNYGVRSTSVASKPISNNITQRKQYILTSGKDLDEEIKKIHQKIKKSEQQKRRLNIKFQDFKELPLQNRRYSDRIDIMSSDKYKIQTKRRIQPEPIMPINKIPEAKVPRLNIAPVAKLEQSYQPSSKPDQRPLSRSNSMAKIETKKLIECLKQQVILDSQLRDAKLQFSFDENNSQKWNKLQQYLLSHDIRLNEEQLKIEFLITLQQHDPFFSVRQSAQNLEMLSAKYAESSRYWANNIKNKFKKEALLSEDFKQQKLDMERKGCLTIQDFVRFLNIETGTFYRNRDLIVLFRRFTKDPQISFKELLNLLTY